MTIDGKDEDVDGNDRKVNTTAKTGKEQQNRLPNERDESPDDDASPNTGPDSPSRGVIKQAASDLKRGLVDTDARAGRGVEKVTEAPAKTAKPLPETTKEFAPKTRS